MPPKTSRKPNQTTAKKGQTKPKRGRVKECGVTGKTVGELLFQWDNVSCKELEILLDRAGCDREHYRQRWNNVLKTLNEYSVPPSASKYTQSLMDKIAENVGAEFFGAEFVPDIRKRYGWTIRMNREPQKGLGAAITGTNRRIVYDENGNRIDLRIFGWQTDVYANIIDTKFPVTGIITNDGWPCYTPLEWVMHIVGHELVHSLHLKLCGYPENQRTYSAGHTRKFLLLNKLLLGGRGHKWMIGFSEPDSDSYSDSDSQPDAETSRQYETQVIDVDDSD